MLLETIDEPFDTITQPVDSLVKGASSMLVLTPWDRVTNTLPPQVTAKAWATVALVTDQSARTQPGTPRAASANGPLFQQLPDDALLVPVTRRQDERHQLATAFSPNMNLGAHSSTTSTQSFSFGAAFFAPAACWWARTVVPSTKWTSQSTVPWSSAVAWTWARMPSQMPALRQRWNRLYTVGQGPYRSGRSRHGAPVRSTHRIPLTTCRSSFRGRPSFARPGSRGSSFSHCSFVRSPRCMPSNLTSFDQFAYPP